MLKESKFRRTEGGVAGAEAGASVKMASSNIMRTGSSMAPVTRPLVLSCCSCSALRLLHFGLIGIQTTILLPGKDHQFPLILEDEVPAVPHNQGSLFLVENQLVC